LRQNESLVVRAVVVVARVCVRPDRGFRWDPSFPPAVREPRALLRGWGAELEVDRLGLAAVTVTVGLLRAELFVPRVELVRSRVEIRDRELAVASGVDEKGVVKTPA
jgi:hypothetical protein